MDAWRKGRILQDYQVHFVTRGKGEFQSKPSGTKQIVAGTVFLLFPGVWHYYRPVSNVGWEDYWIDCNGQNVDRLVEQGFISPADPVLNTGVDDLILRDYTTLLDRLGSEPPGFEQLLAASAMEILAAALAAARVQKTGNHIHELVCKAKSLLEAQAEPIPAVEAVAASLGISIAHFYRVFKGQTGLSPYQYHSQLRIERAKQMLHGTTMSVKQIAAALAFENPFHFSKAFKQKTGMSPSQLAATGAPRRGHLRSKRHIMDLHVDAHLWCLGTYAERYVPGGYFDPMSVEEQLQRMAGIEGLEGLFVFYPTAPLARRS